MGTARFPKRVRLLSRDQFQAVFNKSVRTNQACITVLASRNGLGYARLGLAVPKKAAKLAVTRNRVKRIIRESFRRNQDRLGGLDLVVLVRPGVTDKTNPELRDIMEQLWRRVLGRCKSS